MTRMLAAYVATFTVLHVYWDIAEAAAPGQQYADPLLPVLACSLLVGGPVWMVWELIRTWPSQGGAR